MGLFDGIGDFIRDLPRPSIPLPTFDPAELRVKSIDIVGLREPGLPTVITTTIENTGDLPYLGAIDVEYLVNGEVIGNSTLNLGLAAGLTWPQTEAHIFTKGGLNSVEVRIVGANDANTSNNSLRENFVFDAYPDIAVTDVDIITPQVAGLPALIKATVTNTEGEYYTAPIDIEYLVNGSVIGESTFSLGMLGNFSDFETELYTFTQPGMNSVEVRIVDGGDSNSSNDSLTRDFSFANPLPDIVVGDVRVLDNNWSSGTVQIETFIENQGALPVSFLDGPITVEYFVDGQSFATDEVGPEIFGVDVNLGMFPGIGAWESTTLTGLSPNAPHEIEVVVSTGAQEVSKANNAWAEEFRNDHQTGTQKTLANSSADVELGMFMARTVYGLEHVPGPDTDNGLDDAYDDYLNAAGWEVLGQDALTAPGYLTSEQGKVKWGDGGLFQGDAPQEAFNLEVIPLFQNFAAQGLLALGESPEGEKTLALTFRGTDGSDTLDATFGQAFTGSGISQYYEAMRPLINAALAYANDSSNGIEKLVVSGHSLGGATADLFALVDAQRLDESVDLTVVSLASAGLNGSVFQDNFLGRDMVGQFDPRYVSDPSGDNYTLTAPSYYVGLSFTNDPVTFDHQNPVGVGPQNVDRDLSPPISIDPPILDGGLPDPQFIVPDLLGDYPRLTPNFTLNNNENLDSGLTPVDLVNVSLAAQKSADGPDTLGFGSEHNPGLYWAMMANLARDPLVSAWDGHQIKMGETDYSNVTDFGQEPSIDEEGVDANAFATFLGYADNRPAGDGYENDTGARRVEGTSSRDYLLGVSGDDEIDGRGGDDLLSGGHGDDLMDGGDGADRLLGGEGNDTIDGGTGEDTAIYLGSLDRYTVQIEDDQVTVTDRAEDGDGIDVLVDVEKLEFGDGTSFDLTRQTGIADLDTSAISTFIELYIAYFNRAPDAIGLNFWGSVFAEGLSLEEIAADFLTQPETMAAYPTSMSIQDFAEQVYSNVLGRIPDQDGLDFWVDTLSSGGVSRDQFILEVLRGAKADPADGASQSFIDLQLADRAYLEEKTDLGTHFAVVLGMSDVEDARTVMDVFERGGAATLDDAVALTNDLFEDAASILPETGDLLVQLVGNVDLPFDFGLL